MCYAPVYQDSEYLYRVAPAIDNMFGIEMVPLAYGLGGSGNLFIPSGLTSENSAVIWLKKYAREHRLRKWR